MAHGANGIYEGGVGFYEGNSNVDGPLRSGYKLAAKELGFSESVGSLAYDLVDFGLSLHGKLKLVPKLNDFGEAEKNLFLKKYGRQDLERAYKQMTSKLLAIELFSDAVALSKIIVEVKKLFVLDQKNNDVTMIISDPEEITNVKEIVEDCYLAILIDGSSNSDSPSTIKICTDQDGNRYTTDLDGNPLDK